MKKCPATAVVFLLLAAPGWSGTGATLRAQHLPPQFEAVYEVRKGDLLIGKMQLSLRKEGDKLVYKSRTFPVGIAAAVMGNQEKTYRALLEKTKDHYRTVEFKHEVSGSDKGYSEHYTFDWNSHTAHVRYKDRNSTLNIPPHTFDSFSVQLLLMREPDSEVTSYTYPVISKGRLKDYEYKLELDQPIQTKLGNVTAHRFVREKNDKKRTRYTGWYSQSLYYIPVRSEKSRNGKIEYSAQITEVKWL